MLYDTARAGFGCIIIQLLRNTVFRCISFHYDTNPPPVHEHFFLYTQCITVCSPAACETNHFTHEPPPPHWKQNLKNTKFHRDPHYHRRKKTPTTQPYKTAGSIRTGKRTRKERFYEKRDASTGTVTSITSACYRNPGADVGRPRWGWGGLVARLREGWQAQARESGSRGGSLPPQCVSCRGRGSVGTACPVFTGLGCLGEV